MIVKLKGDNINDPESKRRVQFKNCNIFSDLALFVRQFEFALEPQKQTFGFKNNKQMKFVL